MLLYVFDKLLELSTLLVVFAHSLVYSIELDDNHYNEKYFRKKNKFPVGPALLRFFLFIVVDSAVFQILNMTTSQGGNTVY